MRADFRILGDIEVQIGDGLVDVGHARQRCVLVVLILTANRVVPADQLLERVWGQQPPRRARSVLSGYLSRLRKVLGSADGVSISWTSGGYVLSADPMIIDVNRFRQLVAKGRATEDADEAAELLAEALRGYRGEPFSTLDTPWLNEARAGLEAERFAVELDRNELALRAGRHSEVLSELSVGVRTHPLEERLVGQLILALYRCGRQSDALAAFQKARQRLLEELGTNPGPKLQDLYRQILAGDPALAAPSVTARTSRVSASVTVPRQLPPPPRAFSGRSRELAELDSLIAAADDDSSTVIISAVSGTGGVGKTALALQWAHLNADRFPDGQLYINLRGFDPSGMAVTPGEAIRGLLEALGVQSQQIPSSAEAQVGLYRSLLAGRRILLVLDNVRDEEQIRSLLPGAAGCLALVTSRHQLIGLMVADGAVPLALDLLTHDEARALLGRRLGADRIATEPRAVDDIVALCARLPLALAIVAARAAGRQGLQLAELAEQLRDIRDRLDMLEIGDETIDVRGVFSWSYNALSADGARLFRLLGVHPGPDISVPATASLAGCSIPAVRLMLDELTRANLITESSPGRYTFHDLLRAYASEVAEIFEPADERNAAAHRILSHYLHSANAADDLLYPHRDAVDLPEPVPRIAIENFGDAGHAFDWFMRERQVLLGVTRLASECAHDSYTWRFAYFMVNFLDRSGRWPEWVEAQENALRAATARADRQGQAFAHRGLQRAYLQMGRLDGSDRYGRLALEAFADVGDRPGQAQTHLALGVSSMRRGNAAEALAHSLRAQELYEAAGHRAGVANALNNAGFTYVFLGQYEQALAVCQQAVELERAIGDRYLKGMTWDSIGYAHHHLGNFADAIMSYRNALEVLREQGDRCSEADTMVRLGDSHYAAGDHESARRDWVHALEVYEELGHPELDTLRTDLASRLDETDRSATEGAVTALIVPSVVKSDI